MSKVQLSGHFKLIAHSKARGRRVLAEFDNLILDAGLNRLGTGGGDGWCQVGTSPTAVAASQTALGNRLASTSTRVAVQQSYVAGPPPYTQTTDTYRFAEGTAAGTLAEVGIGWASSGSLFSRALILDGGGSPTTITVLSDESLDVEYTFRLYPPTTDWTGNVTIAGVSYAVTVRAANIDVTQYSGRGWDPSRILAAGFQMINGFATPRAYDGVIGAITDNNPSGNESVQGTAVDSSYSNGSLVRQITETFSSSQGNLAGHISAIAFGWDGVLFQAGFSPDIPKTSSNVLNLVFQISWARRP